MIFSHLTVHGRIARGYFLAIIASITYGFNPLFALPLYSQGYDVLSVLFYRYLLAGLILGGLMAYKGLPFSLDRKLWLPILCAGLLFALSSITLFESYKYMDVGIASTLLYVTPFFVAIIMATFFHRKLSLRSLLCIAVALVGIGFLSIKYDSTIQNPTGIAYVVCSALVYSIYIILLKETRLRLMNSITLTFYSVCVGALFYFIGMNFGAGLVIPHFTFSEIYNIAGLAIFPTIISIVAMTVAIKIIGPVPTSILEALEPVTALVIGCMIFGEKLTLLNIAGILIVLTSVSYFVISDSEHKLKKHLTEIK